MRSAAFQTPARGRLAPLCVALLLAAPVALAQSAPPQPDHGAMHGMDHGAMKQMDHGDAKPLDHGSMPGMDHDRMKGMDHGGTKGKDHKAKKPMDHRSMKRMEHGSAKPMDHGAMQGMDHGDMKHMDHGGAKPMDHGAMQGMDHGAMKGMDHGSMRAEEPAGMSGMDHGAMQGMDHGRMQGGSAPPDARDPDAYSDGLTLGAMTGMDMADNDPYGQLLLDQFEGFRTNSGEAGIRLDAQGWYGTDLNKIWGKVEGSKSEGRLGATRTELLYDRAFAPYFGWQAGVRHDFGGGGPGRNWAALGIQGLAPYWFDVEATFYVGPSGRTALRLEAEYDLRITQRLVLQPDVEFKLFGKNDAERGIGSGLSETELGLRLRYEITRKFAPYIGVSWGRKFGNTADFARRAGEPVGESRIVAGLRLWY